MQTLRKLGRFISSMRFAIGLLIVLAAACAVSSLVPQGQSAAWYNQRYPARAAGLILALHLDDAFHSWWFAAVTAFLCLNLALCNVVRLPGLLRRFRSFGGPAGAPAGPGDARVEGVADPEIVFRRLRMPAPKATVDAEGREVRYACRHRAGLFGAWVCHAGILLLVAGFALGGMTQQQYAVYGVPGQSKPVGDSGLAVTIDDFRVTLRPNDTVEQYASDITVRDLATGEARSATVGVNAPAGLFGMKFYQNSTGWAADVTVRKGGGAVQEEVVCAGDYLRVEDNPELVVYFNAFYPDYVMTATGPATASDKPVNPAYLYSVYYQERMLGMNALTGDEVLTIDDYTVTFSEPQRYTLIEVKRDAFAPLALLGGLAVLAGLALALYAQPARVWAVRGGDGLWTVTGACPKGGALFRTRFEKAVRGEDAYAGR